MNRLTVGAAAAAAAARASGAAGATKASLTAVPAAVPPSPSRRALNHAGPGLLRLVVLDLNGVLLYRAPRSGTAAGVPRPVHRTHDLKQGQNYIYLRPYAQEFLLFLLNNFHVAIWSSAKASNVHAMVNLIIPPPQIARLAFIWHQDDCLTAPGVMSSENRKKPIFLKHLRKIYTKPEFHGRYTLDNTLLLDDSPEKAMYNEPYTSFHPHSYDPNDPHDDALSCNGALRAVFEDLKTSRTTIQSFLHRFHPDRCIARGPPVSSSPPPNNSYRQYQPTGTSSPSYTNHHSAGRDQSRRNRNYSSLSAAQHDAQPNDPENYDYSVLLSHTAGEVQHGNHQTYPGAARPSYQSQQTATDVSWNTRSLATHHSTISHSRNPIATNRGGDLQPAPNCDMNNHQFANLQNPSAIYSQPANNHTDPQSDPVQQYLDTYPALGFGEERADSHNISADNFQAPHDHKYASRSDRSYNAQPATEFTQDFRAAPYNLDCYRPMNGERPESEVRYSTSRLSRQSQRKHGNQSNRHV